MNAPAEVSTTRPVMSNGHLFMSPLGLFGFQADAVADAYVHGDRILVVDRGLGKTLIMLALAAQLFEDDEIDLVVCVAQANKLAKDEFPADWARFTSLRTHRYLGAGREKRLASALTDGIDVLLTTYETGKLDLVSWVKTGGRGRGKRTDGPLMQALGLRGKRCLWLFDEVLKLSGRSSELYQSFDYLLGPPGRGGGQLRTGPHRQRVIGLSANPMSADQYVQSFNVARLIDPSSMPTIGEFDERYTYGKDDRDQYLYRAAARTDFAPLFASLVHRKRNSDPDVATQMPRLSEKLIDVRLEPAHRALYDAVSGIYGLEWDELSEQQRGKLSSALRLAVGHPRALTRSSAELPVAITAELGADGLAAIPSSKTLRLLRELETLAGRRVLIFTFFAETVLPELLADLLGANYRVGTYTGSDAASLAAKTAFQAGEVDVLLSSDAGAKGLNLPEAEVVIEYESAKTFEQRMQRFGRGQRITSTSSHVYGLTLIARATLEEYTLATVLRRNRTQDDLLGDTHAAGYLTAADRKTVLEATRS